MASIKVTGLRELESKLQSLGTIAGSKAMRTALFSASKPILDQARSNAKGLGGSGALALAMGRTFSTKAKGLSIDSEGSAFTISIGPRLKHRTAIALHNMFHKRRSPIRGIFYGHLIEFDHKTRPRRMALQLTLSKVNSKKGVKTWRKRSWDRSGQRTVPGKHILSNALQVSYQKSVNILAIKLEQAIKKALR